MKNAIYLLFACLTAAAILTTLTTLSPSGFAEAELRRKHALDAKMKRHLALMPRETRYDAAGQSYWENIHAPETE